MWQIHLENARFSSPLPWSERMQGGLFKWNKYIYNSGWYEYIWGVCLLVWTLQTSEVAGSSTLCQLTAWQEWFWHGGQDLPVVVHLPTMLSFLADGWYKLLFLDHRADVWLTVIRLVLQGWDCCKKTYDCKNGSIESDRTVQLPVVTSNSCLGRKVKQDNNSHVSRF